MLPNADVLKRALMLTSAPTVAMDMSQTSVAYFLSWEPKEFSARAAGERLSPGSYAQLVGATAIIPVNGPLLRQWGSYERITNDLALALADSRVENILIAIESPGGHVVGCDECAAAIAAANIQKPVTAHIEGVGASAAYWLASQAAQIFASKTAVVGSVGAMYAGIDLVPIFERWGAVKMELRSTQSPEKNPPVGSEALAAQLQPIIDEAGRHFIEALAKGRGIDAETVMARYGKGAVMSAAAALEAGMIDGVKTFSQTLADMADRGNKATGPAAAAGRAIQMEATMDWKDIDAAGLKANRPDIFKAISDEAVAGAADAAKAAVDKARGEGVAAERARITGLNDACLPGYEEQLRAAIERGATPEAFAMEIIRSEKAKGSDYLDARKKAEAEGAPADAVAPRAAPIRDMPGKATDHASAEAIAASEWEKLGAKQSEQLSKEAFIANRMYDLGFPAHTRSAA